MTTNQGARDAVNAFLKSNSERGKALLVSGVWGAGKTHLVKEVISRRFTDPLRKPLYVSLFGLSNWQEIENQVYKSMFGRIGGIARKAAKIVSGRLLGDQIDIAEYSAIYSADLYILDDLERCNDPKTALSYVNYLTDIHDRKVICIANDENLQENDYWSNLAAKAFSAQTKVYPDLDNFLKAREGKSVPPWKSVPLQKLEKILALSGKGNLRSLDHALNELQQLFDAIGNRKNVDEKVIERITETFLILSLEVKSGSLPIEKLRGWDVTSRIIRQMNGEKDLPESIEGVIVKKHPDTELDDLIISHEDIARIIDDGFVIPQHIDKALLQSPAFVQDYEESWKTLWWFVKCHIPGDCKRAS